jgi:hypothetical protein
VPSNSPPVPRSASSQSSNGAAVCSLSRTAGAGLCWTCSTNTPRVRQCTAREHDSSHTSPPDGPATAETAVTRCLRLAFSVWVPIPVTRCLPLAFSVWVPIPVPADRRPDARSEPASLGVWTDAQSRDQLRPDARSEPASLGVWTDASTFCTTGRER